MSPWRLFRNGLSDYRRNWQRYLTITLIVALPTNLIALSASLTADVTISFYTQLASIFMTAALIWAVTHRGDLTGLAVRRSYYEGSAMTLRLILAIIIVALMVIPAALGLTLYNLGTTEGSGATIGVQLLLGGLAVVFLLPTLMWLIRFGFVAFTVADGDYPIAALKTSRRLSLGRFWPTAGRMLGLFGLMLVLTLPALVLVILLALLTHWTGVNQILQLYVNIVVIPVGLLSFHHLYRMLQGAKA